MSLSLDTIKAPVAREMEEFEPKFRASMKTKVLLLDKIMNYIVKRKGKQMRPLFVFLSAEVFGEPHEFQATLLFDNRNSFAFEMFEPEGHVPHEEEDHAYLDDEAHAKAHTETLPTYVQTGQRPTPFQIMTFGAAGGMIPCPASITVMLRRIVFR